MSDHDRPALQRAWPIICRLITLLQTRTRGLSPLRTNPPLWPILQLTRVAESLVRRWLVLKACVEGWPRVRVGREPTAPSTPTRARVGGDKDHPPRFRLTEPLPRMPVWVWQPETETAPAGWCLQYGTGAAQPTSLSRSAAPDPGNLIQRCAALSDVMAHPDQHVRRMAHWLARAAARRKSGPGRPNPFSIGFAPGGRSRRPLTS